ncbi:multimerin-2 precursor [Silurus meridionalis]|nr:multimerin-2 precursor [Silurus meridionalis]
MIVLKNFLILQGLLLAAQCDVWPRVQDLKDGEKKGLKHILSQRQGDWVNGDPYGYSGTGHQSSGEHEENPDVSETAPYPLEHRHGNPSHRHPSEDLTVDTEHGSAKTQSSNNPMRMGNWCAYVHKREVTMAVSCGTEKYIIKSQSPCPIGAPDCHLIMYKLDTRPVYRAKQKLITALLWRCCPGHGGQHCEEIAENSHVIDSNGSDTDIRLHPGGPELKDTESKKLINDHNQEQNDSQDSFHSMYVSQNSEEKQKEKHPSASDGFTPSPQTDHEPHRERGASYGVNNGHQSPPPETHYTNPGLVPIHYLKDVMMSHLQPIFDSFNLTLARLSEEVQDLQKDMTKMLVHQMVQGESKSTGDEISEELMQHEATADTFKQLKELDLQLSLQYNQMEEKIYAQQVMMDYNLTHLKADMDVQIKHNQKMLQMSIHSLNCSLSEVRQQQEHMKEEIQRDLLRASNMQPPDREPQENTAVWEAITRLNNKVISNDADLTALNKHQDQMKTTIENFQNLGKTLEERITQNDRKFEDKYIEAFLEVDAAKVSNEKYADDVSKNVSILQSTVQEMEVDMDYLFTLFYKNMSSGSKDCDCTGLRTSVAQLKQAVANITMIATENRQDLDSATEERLTAQINGGWSPTVEEINLRLHTVENSLATEQDKRRTMHQNLTTLQSSLLGCVMNIEALRKEDDKQTHDIKHLFNAFSSLLKDAIRHSDILEILLGVEVLEFSDWSPQDQKAYSISVLKMLISDLQEQINGHSRSLASMLNSEDATVYEPSELADWLDKDLKWRQEEQKFAHFSEEPIGYKNKDFSALEKTVDQIKAHVIKLGEQQCLSCCNCTQGAASKDLEGNLREELTSVRKSLEDHLRIFRHVFSNTEGLSESEATVDLDKLFALMRKKEVKSQRNRQKKSEDTRGMQRSKRDTSLETAAHSQLLENPLMFVAYSREGANTPGIVVFETMSLNHGQMYSPETGVFRAPSTGVYLFVLTLDFGPGPSLAQLKRGKEVAASLHQGMRKSSGPATRICFLELKQGEEVQLDLVQGTLEHGRPQENTFAGLLLLQTT